MTVLQVCAYAAPYEGNFIKSLKTLGEELALKGHKMIYAFPENARGLQWCINLSEKTDVYFLPLAKARIKPSTYSALKNIYKKHEDLEIIHSHFELYDAPVSLTAPKGVKVFWHLHDALEMYSGLKHRIVHKVQYGLLHKKAVLLSVSQKHMNYVLKCGFPKERAKYLPNGLDLERIKLVSTQVKDRKYDFTIFGWEYERKGVDLAIKAVLATKREMKIAVVGNEDTTGIIQEQFGKVDVVEVIEPVRDINELYKDTKCFLHISRAEGLSYALLEAVYAGLPVICSDIDENKFAQVFPTVIMTEKENTNSIAEAMMNQLECCDVDEQKVNVSREIIEQEYSISCWVRNILEQYEVE